MTKTMTTMMKQSPPKKNPKAATKVRSGQPEADHGRTLHAMYQLAAAAEALEDGEDSLPTNVSYLLDVAPRHLEGTSNE